MFSDFNGLDGAGNKVRTRDPLITNQVLYQLSYTGVRGHLAFDAALGNGGATVKLARL